MAGGKVLRNKTRGAAQEEAIQTAAAKIAEHQRELHQRLQDEGLAKHSEGAGGYGRNEGKGWKRFQSYKGEAALPKEAENLRVRLPLIDMQGFIKGGQPDLRGSQSTDDHTPHSWLRRSVPHQYDQKRQQERGGRIHIPTCQFPNPWPTRWQEGGYSKSFTLSAVHAIDLLQPFEDPDATFIRSISYRSVDGHRFDLLTKQITDLKKEVNKREQQKKEMADVIEQDTLVEIKGRRPTKLPEVFIRPALDGKRLPGEVEIHQNGLRYQSPMGSQKVGASYTLW